MWKTCPDRGGRSSGAWRTRVHSACHCPVPGFPTSWHASTSVSIVIASTSPRHCLGSACWCTTAGGWMSSELAGSARDARAAMVVLDGVLRLTLLLAFALAGCASVPATAPTPAMAGDPARPSQATAWIRSELYFAVGNEDGSDNIDEARWRDFLDRQVTPRFPDGLTVIDGHGQW